MREAMNLHPLAPGEIDVFTSVPVMLPLDIAYDTTITLYEKDQTYFSDVDSIADALRPKAEVFSVSFKGTTFTARQSRTNPVVVPDISRQLSPFKTYVLAVYCPNLHDVTGNDHCVMNNIWLSLRFRSRLVARDEVVAADVELQNVPVLHKGGHTGPLISQPLPRRSRTG